MINKITVQVLLVTGGLASNNLLSSTELLLPSATSWTFSAALPSPREYLRGATLDNKVVITGSNTDILIIYIKYITRHDLSYKYYNSLLHNAGGWGSNSETLDDILEYDEEKQEWNKIGTISMKRELHAISVINYNSIKDYCNW